MISPTLSAFLAGAVFMGEAVVALLFLHMWRRTSDRLFAWFAAAFITLALERTALLFGGSNVNPEVYSMRLLAFSLIIVAVIDRNRCE
jgi:hypothetical protein